MNRAERRQRTKRIVQRRIEVIRWSNMYERVDDRLLGRCKTLHPFDCGRSRCGICSLHKRKWSGKTFQEKKADLEYQESMQEI